MKTLIEKNQFQRRMERRKKLAKRVSKPRKPKTLLQDRFLMREIDMGTTLVHIMMMRRKTTDMFHSPRIAEHPRKPSILTMIMIPEVTVLLRQEVVPELEEDTIHQEVVPLSSTLEVLHQAT